MSLIIDITHKAGRFQLTAQGELHGPASALTGPSGAGKTTLLHIVSGLIKPDRGRIVFNGEVWCDTAARFFLPAHKRRIGYVFQEGRLFPHLSVRHNLTYGRWFARPDTRAASLEDVATLLGIEHLLDRQVRNLSGGEQQRIAIGRALLARPQILLMDEPLASLDAARRAEIMPYIQRLRDETRLPMIYVSHSADEIAQIANEVFRIEDGHLQSAGKLV